MNFIRQNTFYFVISSLFFFFLGYLSCRGTRSGVSNNTNGNNATQTPQIIFLNYSVKLNKSIGDYEIRLININIAEGKLKINSFSPGIKKPGDLRCIALDNNLEPVDSIIISDPLNITVESVNENNALFKKEIVRDSAQFSVRMQLNEKIRAFGIKKHSNSKYQDSYLLVTKIKYP